MLAARLAQVFFIRYNKFKNDHFFTVLTMFSIITLELIPPSLLLIQIISGNPVENINSFAKTSYKAPIHYLIYIISANLVLAELFCLYFGTMGAVGHVFSRYIIIK